MPKDLRATLRDLQHTHMVLIDTMGMSQRDRMVGEQVAMFGDSDVRSLLLLAATSRGDTLDDVVSAYSGIDLAGCVLTKVDEAASLASSLDVIIRHELAFVLCLEWAAGAGRSASAEPTVSSPSCLQGPARDSSPHRLAGVEPGLMMASGAKACCLSEDSVADFRGDQAAGLRRLLGRPRLRIVSFNAGGTGVGKSVAVANLAASLARVGREVLVVDENTLTTALLLFTALLRRRSAAGGRVGKALDEVLLPLRRESVYCRRPASIGQLGALERGRAADAAGLSGRDGAPGRRRPRRYLARIIRSGFSPLGLAAQETVDCRPPDVNAITEAYALIKKVSLGYAHRRFRILLSRVRSEAKRRRSTTTWRASPTAAGWRVSSMPAVPVDEQLRQASRLCQPVAGLFPGLAGGTGLSERSPSSLLNWPAQR
jgi:flagellar biosynthesis protein FlhG